MTLEQQIDDIWEVRHSWFEKTTCAKETAQRELCGAQGVLYTQTIAKTLLLVEENLLIAQLSPSEYVRECARHIILIKGKHLENN